MTRKIGALIVCMMENIAALFAQTEAGFDTEAEGAPSGDGVVITKYKRKGGNVVIPAAIGGKIVVGIAKWAFSDCIGLSSITLPAGVTSIGEEAFSGCSRLKAISVASANKQYKDIDGVLFTKDGKTLLAYPAGKPQTTYSIPSGVTFIDESAFLGCKSLSAVTIPASVTSIGEAAFAGCSGLTSVTIPAGVTRIGDSAFALCTGLISITIPASITSIGRSAFSGCTSLKPEVRAAIEKRFGKGVFE